jgi:hypothetical protein
MNKALPTPAHDPADASPATTRRTIRAAGLTAEAAGSSEGNAGKELSPGTTSRLSRGRRAHQALPTTTQAGTGSATTQHEAAPHAGEAMVSSHEQPPSGQPQLTQTPGHIPAQGCDAEPKPAPAAAASASQDAAALERQLLSRPSPSLDIVPASNQDLILKIWNSLAWDKTIQVAVIITVIGIMVALILLGLGLLAHALIGTPTAWSAIASIVAGSGAGEVRYRTARRRRRRP